jgi:hypothetical protein
MNAFVVALYGLLLSVTPLTDGQSVRLETAMDGRDHQEEAFVALLDNVRSWDIDAIPGDSPVIVQPDFETMLVNPDQWRGALCRIEGVIQQRNQLDRPFEGVHEWFVRTEDGRPILLFITALDEATADRVRDGRGVVVYARFYKRIDAVARDGEEHRYPAFVGRGPALTGGVVDTGGLGMLVAVVLPIAGLLVVFLLVWMWSRRRSTRRLAVAAHREAGIEVDDGGPLPDDPCEALGELKRRAEDRD